MENDEFNDVSWQTGPHGNTEEGAGSTSAAAAGEARPSNTERLANGSEDGHGEDPLDNAGIGNASLDCTVSAPLKENDGSKDAYVSYLVTTVTNFPSFQKPTTSVRRRFTDFVFLYNTLCSEYPQCAVPPLPDKHSMMYVTGDRFSSEFMQRRANSLNRFLRRLTLHPVLRRSTLLIIFLESQDWNATMRVRPSRSSSSGEPPAGVFDGITETFINAFTKVHKADRRFLDVRDQSDKLDDDLGHLEKTVARVARREDDLARDLHDLADSLQRLAALEPALDGPVLGFVAAIGAQAAGLRALRDHTDHDYLGSLRDMQAYSAALKALLKLRDAKQVDFEQTAVLLADTTAARDRAAAAGAGGQHGGAGGGAGGFLRAKLEDVRGVDHEQARRKRVREAEVRIEELARAVEEAQRVTEAFDEEVLREVGDFGRIKRGEFKGQFGALADAHVDFYGGVVESWEGFVREMEGEGRVVA